MNGSWRQFWRRVTSFRVALTTLAALLVVCGGSAEAADRSKLAAWAIGDNLSLAALLAAQGASQDLVDKSMEKAKSAAKAAGVEVEPLPAREKTSAETLAAMIHYLIKGDGWSTGEALATKYGAVEGALFEIAVKSNLGIVLYAPGDDSGLAKIIQSRCEAIGLPARLWTPVVSAMQNKRPQEEVKQAIFKMHADIAEMLSNGAGRAPSTVGELLGAGGRQLTRDEIAKGFAGATIEGEAMGYPGAKFLLRYSADGAAAGNGLSPQGWIAISGTWSANERNQYCQDLRTTAGNTIRGCFYYFVMGVRLFAAPTAERTAPVYERRFTR